MFLKLLQFWNAMIFLRIILSESHAVKKIENRVLGKTYWFYETKKNWSLAEKTCQENKQELVQLPTKQEQDWLAKHFGATKMFWVGVTEFHGRLFWKVPHGRISVNKDNFFIDPFNDVSAVSFHDDHLHSSSKMELKSVLCQIDYSQKKGNFKKLNGKNVFRERIATFRGDKLKCASKCLMLNKCNVFCVHFAANECQLYEKSSRESEKDLKIDASSTNAVCFSMKKE